ncbi:c2H2-type domain-containing protein [Trichonephila clavata]|uniref:C2H2-type domain-containing protein n=1 Tax=Trichonephila clavata TaxID=2740835 RepID=A0A8X6ITJ0_TRICU|nr:c2H2-type domain-containing protein [Trichonephila clavata]
MEKDNKEKPTCCHCSKQFTTTSNMYQHIREVHGVEPVNFGRLRCPGCGNNFPNYESIRTHVSREHNVKCELEEHRFHTEKDFFEWKRKVEEEKKCLYVRHSAARISAAKENVYYYICHRSGLSKSRSTGKRPSKLESNKMNAHCPSTMMVKVSKRVYVVYCPVHYGHDQSLGRDRRNVKGQGSKEEKVKSPLDRINEGLKSSLQKVLDGIQHGAEVSQQIHALTKKDVQSIKKDFILLNSADSHENDATGIRLWVQSVSQCEEDNPVIFYKDQGESDITGFLSEQDFCLIFMTKMQQKMLMDFCNPKICVDFNHGPNSQDYFLTTLLTIDEFDNGCPVAYCICNRINLELINFFYHYVRSKVGVITANVFLSDDAPEFYNAWEVCMTPTQHQFLCPWLVDRCWRKHLSKISSRIKKVSVYKTLVALMQEPNVETFLETENNFVKLLEDDPDTRKFKTFYSSHYAQCTQQWAYCYTKHVGLNTTVYLESFHKTMKHVYLEGKKIKRIDKTLDALLKLTKNKIFEKLCNSSRKVPSASITNMHQKESQSIALVSTIADDKEWIIKPSLENVSSYIVKKIDVPICRMCKCFPVLSNRNVCVHEYECTCYDNLIKLNICEHIQTCLGVQECKNKLSALGQKVNNSTNISKEQNLHNLDSSTQTVFNEKLMHLKEMSNAKFPDTTYAQANKLLDKCLLLFNEAKEVNSVITPTPQIQ